MKAWNVSRSADHSTWYPCEPLCVPSNSKISCHTGEKSWDPESFLLQMHLGQQTSSWESYHYASQVSAECRGKWQKLPNLPDMDIRSWTCSSDHRQKASTRDQPRQPDVEMWYVFRWVTEEKVTWWETCITCPWNRWISSKLKHLVWKDLKRLNRYHPDSRDSKHSRSATQKVPKSRRHEIPESKYPHRCRIQGNLKILQDLLKVHCRLIPGISSPW